MFKKISKFIDIILFIVVIFMMTSAIGNVSASKPLFMSSIRSNSMYPLFQRGDVIFLQSLKPEDEKKIGDIIVFRDMEGDLSDKGYIVHRIHEGNIEDGFITRGDNNNDTDQRLGKVPRIKNEWIYSKVVTFGEYPIVLPKIGYLSLIVVENDNSDKLPYLIGGVVALLVFVEISNQIKNRKQAKRKKKRKRSGKKGLDLIAPSLIFITCGLTLSMLIFAATFTMGQNFSVFYGVSEQEALLQGSDIGSLPLGKSYVAPLLPVKNNGIFPLYVKVYTDDKQFNPSLDEFVLRAGERANLKYTIEANEIGIYKTKVFIGLFYPLLPPKLMFALGSKSYWPIVLWISILPALPLYLYPVFNQSHRSNIKRYLSTLF